MGPNICTGTKGQLTPTFKGFVGPREALEINPYCGSPTRELGAGKPLEEHSKHGTDRPRKDEVFVAHYQKTRQRGAVMNFRYIAVFANEHDEPPPFINDSKEHIVLYSWSNL